MVQKKIFIQAAEQISMQQPLSEQWMQQPLSYTDSMVRAVDPVFRDYMAPNEVRRMGNVMKRAIVTTLEIMKDTGIEHPDAIITGTSSGCLDYTERFLKVMVENDEETLSPTYFMQSTHNTIGSALGIYTKTHGYNVTYSHGSSSFDQALLDAWMQMKLEKIGTALVGGHDEMQEDYFRLLCKTDFVGKEKMVPCGEVAVEMMLNADAEKDALCEIGGVWIGHRPAVETLQLKLEEILSNAEMTKKQLAAVMVGVNGKTSYDQHYNGLLDSLQINQPRLHYKHLFGESFTASAFGVYAAAHCLKTGSAPDFLYCGTPLQKEPLESILVLNLTEEHDCSLILLKA